VTRPLLPGATIGVLGGGQLGRMFATSARQLGYRVHTYSPDGEVAGAYGDLDRIRKFARCVDVVTFEFEGVPLPAASAAAECVPVRPAGAVLHITQHRLREKEFLVRNGFPVTPHVAVHSFAELRHGMSTLGCPAMLKAADFSSEGQGKVKISCHGNQDAAWDALDRRECVLEAWVDCECELSVVAARGLDGSFAHYGVVRNDHVHRVLDVSVAPAVVPGSVECAAVEMARGVLEKLDVVGVLCVEFFLARDGRLLISELAPLPHNSGHFTLDACVTSHFEQQLRAVCNLPLGSTEQTRPTAMANLFGDLWERGEPRWDAALAFPAVKLYLYGRAEAQPGRKMGHLTALGADAEARVRAARRALQRETD
jgi:5-(carboxyamino)imidazole ribonucleotide synthase